MLEQNKFL